MSWPTMVLCEMRQQVKKGDHALVYVALSPMPVMQMYEMLHAPLFIYFFSYKHRK
jgi:hypothetical protein